jgi:hypothetical protein
MANIIELKHAQKLHGGDGTIVSEVVKITPAMATAWLRANRKNRPVRKRHIMFLASELLSGNWKVNGQAIIIAENENVLDGQHRLMACIEAGIPFETLVVYGVKEEAFATIDTGAVRSGADALCLHFSEYPINTVKAVATAVTWVRPLEKGNIHHCNAKMSNTDIIEYAKEHLTLFHRAETLQGYPKDNRPISVGVGTALYEVFARKNEELADCFMNDLYTGEKLERNDVAFVLRNAFQKDAQRTTSKLPTSIKARMIIKGWNWRRRGMPMATYQTVTVSANDEQRISIL